MSEQERALGAPAAGFHELKTWPEYFDQINVGSKTFELRQNDRGFAVGDTLMLREYDPLSGDYTGRELFVAVTYMTRGGHFGLRPGWCVLSVRKLEAPKARAQRPRKALEIPPLPPPSDSKG